MKKALVILMALAMIFSAFAAEPVANLGLKEFKGDASLSWSYDFDDGKFGMKNDANASIAFTLFDAGDKVTEGEGIWGELKIKTGDAVDFPGLKVTADTDDDGNAIYPVASTFGASVDVAKIHFGNIVAVSILKPNLAIGDIGVAAATGANVAKVTKEDAAPENAAGFTVEVTTDPVDFNLAVADNGVANNKKYGFKADASLKAYENLTLKAAANYKDAFAVAGEIGYKFAINDTFSVTPAGAVFYKDAFEWVGGVLFGWGEDGQEAKLDYVSDKCSNGVSVGANSNKELVIGAFDNTFLKDFGLTVGADYVATFDTLAKGTAQAAVKFAKDIDVFGVSAHAGVKADLSADEVSPEYKYGVAVSNKTFIQNTTLEVKYEGEKDKAGSVSASAKISF